MGPIPSDAGAAARFTALLQDALTQQQFVQDILQNLPDYTKSGTDPRVPRTSRAIARIPIPEATTIPNLPHTYGVGEVPVHELVQQQSARAAEIEILRAAQALNAPVPANAPNMPRPLPGTPAVPRRIPVAAINSFLAFLQGALYPTDLNQGEDAELARRRGESGPTEAPPNMVPEVRQQVPFLK